MDSILQYFPQLTDHQKLLFSQLKPIYEEWNAKINLISRRDMENFYIHHVLFSLSIAKVIQFLPGTRLIDIGTGGGFPGIPLAILFPRVEFVLLDSIGKKIKVVDEVKNTLALTNILTVQSRSENFTGKFDFVLGRAVTALPDFCRQNAHLVSPGKKNSLPNGIIYLTGGAVDFSGIPKHNTINSWQLNNYFQEEFFTTKKIFHIGYT
ncbi:MAG: 16S rRNA (guanine(527)-N(7))-methyltransferase RsmG [Bacteroidales bacterium]